MCAHYKKIEKNIQKSTAESYRGMIYGRIRRYFTAHNNLTVGNITSKDIENFYEWIFESGVVANTVIHYHTILLDTKVIEYKENSKVIVEPVEEMKNKSSRRTLPLPDPVYEMLCKEREKQDLHRRLFKGSYNCKFDDYICVDQLGELLRLNRVTQRFADLIKRYDLRKIRFHNLRYTFAGILINQDVPLLNVSTLLGHPDLSTTVNIRNRNTNTLNRQSRLILYKYLLA